MTSSISNPYFPSPLRSGVPSLQSALTLYVTSLVDTPLPLTSTAGPQAVQHRLLIRWSKSDHAESDHHKSPAHLHFICIHAPACHRHFISAFPEHMLDVEEYAVCRVPGAVHSNPAPSAAYITIYGSSF